MSAVCGLKFHQININLKFWVHFCIYLVGFLSCYPCCYACNDCDHTEVSASTQSHTSKKSPDPCQHACSPFFCCDSCHLITVIKFQVFQVQERLEVLTPLSFFSGSPKYPYLAVHSPPPITNK